jgi:hypothetical protein
MNPVPPALHGERERVAGMRSIVSTVRRAVKRTQREETARDFVPNAPAAVDARGG